MNNPIKVIHKIKNDNRKTHYQLFIFIGNLIPNKLLDILISFKNKDFYTTLETITKKDYITLENFYGIKWYFYFFIRKHIKHQINEIILEKFKNMKIKLKYGHAWYQEHIIDYKSEYKNYSFASNYYDSLSIEKKKDIEKDKFDIDFTSAQIGAGVYDDDEDDKNEDDLDDNLDDELDDIFEDTINEDFNINEIAKLYEQIDIVKPKDIIETSKIINKILNTKNISTDNLFENKYNDSIDDLIYDTFITDIYKKNYVTKYFIFKDDTIASIKNKVCMTIESSSRYHKIKLLPEMQYYWSEYKYTDINNNNIKDYVTLGHKWMRKNELLKIDIIPNENITIYEKLKNNLNYFKNTTRYKIKREDNEYNTLNYYDNYMTNNEIFMINIYSELGNGYTVDVNDKQNLYDVYANIYFPLISYDRFEDILNFLNNDIQKELIFNNIKFGTIQNNIKLENEIENIVEKYKLESNLYNNLFYSNHILQTIIHVDCSNIKNITGSTSSKFNLYIIFDNFIVNDNYPFIQYQSPDGQIVYKFYNDKNNEINNKWFESIPGGISFKIKGSGIDENKFSSINLQETGKIEYKITWKESECMTIDKIILTHDSIRNLLNKINSENKKIKIILPESKKFSYAFINTILKFDIPDKYTINHNDLSELSRYFYTYVALVIEPKKRRAKNVITEVTSKYGTYLRYKRIDKYENQLKIYLRILYYLRNYELTDKELVNEIAKQFNITIERASYSLDYVKLKYKKIIKKKVNKTHKSLENIPKSKPPGIAIDILGRERTNYKIRITGTRNEQQLINILAFVKVLIYLYIEIYLYKNIKLQSIKNKLKELTKIAHRRNKVIDIVNYEQTENNIKSVISLDKNRLGFKPNKGQNQWTRACQNSGEFKKRRPEILPDNKIDELLKKGYIYNKKTEFYEKEIIISKNNKTIIKAVKLSSIDNLHNYYICDPKINNEYIYMGFLSKGNNPNNLCMPCCYKKDPMDSVNTEKKNYHLKCLGKINDTEEVGEIVKSYIDKIYILQDTDKIQENKFIYLPHSLNVFFNILHNNTYSVHKHYLVESLTGYYFKYTVKSDNYKFLIAISNIYNITIEDIIKKCIKFLKKDTTNINYTYLNNGKINEIFKKKEEYIELIETSTNLDYDIIGELLGIPNVITPNGINYYIISKHINIVKKILEKDEIIFNYNIQCLNNENNYQLEELNRDTIFLIKDDENYFPIYKIIKKSKETIIQKYFNNNTDSDIINELYKYYIINCNTLYIKNIIFDDELNVKKIIPILINNNIKIITQYVDERYKCKYIKLSNSLLLPTNPSGIINSYTFKYNSVSIDTISFIKTLELLKPIENILNLKYIPKAVIYNNTKDNKINIIAIILHNGLEIPIINEYINNTNIKKLGLFLIFQPLDSILDKIINNYDGIPYYNDSIKNINIHEYKNESYDLYRLELSLFLSTNINIKNELINIVRNKNIDLIDKKNTLRILLYNILNNKISDEFKIRNLSINEDISHLVNEIPDLKDYNISNIREYCNNNINKDTCNLNKHCIWNNNSCKLQITKLYAIDFVNMIVEEFLKDGIQFKEIINENEYYVSDIINSLIYTNRYNQKIIKTSNLNIKKILEELFSKDKIPSIRRKINKYISTTEKYPELLKYGQYSIQEIIPNNDSIIRAYVNSYYWLNNKIYISDIRNLGYYSSLQTSITYILKASIVDFIQNIIDSDIINTNENDINNIPNTIKTHIKEKFKSNNDFFSSTLNKFIKTTLNSDGITELIILSYLIQIPILVYNNFAKLEYIFLQGPVEISEKTIKKFSDPETISNKIVLKFAFSSKIKNIPQTIYSIYY